ncbi:MAG: SpoIVB peptidase [Thermaerobacter sp.]|nr:SpoIVB peptidase [Thermaerobacter sp.]
MANEQEGHDGVWRRAGRAAVGVVLAAGFVALAASGPVRDVASVPGSLEVPVADQVVVPWARWLPVSVQPGPGLSVQRAPRALMVSAQHAGRYGVQLKWFGWLPFKWVPVRVVPSQRVVPGGQSIGVLVHTRGLMVTGYRPLPGPHGTVDPAEAAGVDVGDVITAVNGRPAASRAVLVEAAQAAGRSGRALALTDQGARQTLVRVVHPLYNPTAHRYQVGVAVQDRTSGVGTLTFWNPRTGAYAALGHSLSDGVTRRPVGIASGRMMAATVVGLVPGQPNRAGQKVGVLAGPELVDGTVASNGLFGLTGRLVRPPTVGATKAMPLAVPDQVHPGPARILTVLAGNRPTAYRIWIERAYPQPVPAPKGLLFRVTDRRLLSLTGGVVQGMSGSPILQDGRVVGAVTHVLVSRPTWGYGCYAEWMLSPVVRR